MIKKFLNEIWLIPTILLGFLIMVQVVHTQAHYDAHTEVNDLCIGK
jgi:hypothetical protein